MTTATTAKIITLAGNPNPPSLVALYGGSLGERKTTIADLENDLYATGLSVIDFNSRRFLSESDLSQPLIQQIVTELKSNQDTTGATSDLVNRINESAPATVATHLTSENRIELIHQFDSSLKKLAAISLQKKPLVIIIQGLERAPTGSFISISEFIANYLNIHKFMFVVSIGEEILQNELTSSNSSMSPEDFLEDVFSVIVTFDEMTVEPPTPAPVQDNEDLFVPPAGLVVESGAEIARRKTTKITRKAGGLPKSRIFKVRELTGKHAMIKKGTVPKKKVIKRIKKPAAKPKFKPVPKNEPNKIEAFMKPVLNGDLLTAKKFWSKANELSYSEFTEVVKKITEKTEDRDSRIRATAITALASLANGVSWEMPPEVMDRALILTGDGSKEVRDAAADAIKEMSGAGVETVPQFKPSVAPEISQSDNNMELDELDTDSMLGKDNKSIGSLAIGTGSGGVKMMGGAEEVVSSITTFEVSKEVPSFPAKTEDAPPKFKAVKKKPRNSR
ncbi:MAG: P-loop NTPase fold protein [Candidatus Poseidoniia archaeon]|nr:P-loop NTPase fold protein [Candidatus Poseidoniia archaeon]